MKFILLAFGFYIIVCVTSAPQRSSENRLKPNTAITVEYINQPFDERPQEVESLSRTLSGPLIPTEIVDHERNLPERGDIPINTKYIYSWNCTGYTSPNSHGTTQSPFIPSKPNCKPIFNFPPAQIVQPPVDLPRPLVFTPSYTWPNQPCSSLRWPNHPLPPPQPNLVNFPSMNNCVGTNSHISERINFHHTHSQLPTYNYHFPSLSNPPTMERLHMFPNPPPMERLNMFPNPPPMERLNMFPNLRPMERLNMFPNFPQPNFPLDNYFEFPTQFPDLLPSLRSPPWFPDNTIEPIIPQPKTAPILCATRPLNIQSNPCI